MKEMFKDTGIVLGVCLLFAVFMVAFTPYPATSLVHSLFAKGGVAKEPADYSELLEKVSLKEDLTYESLIPQNKYDLVTPKEGDNFPVIIWVHGGAYVGGQKSDVSVYANMLAAEGYAVVNMEYDLAPNTRYPGPLVQMNDLYKELQKVSDKYSLDLNHLIVAGDSAGGQIASQFINIQMNDQYSQELNFLQEVPKNTIKGAVLFCSPFSLNELATTRRLPLVDYFIRNVGWAYTGKADWAKSDIAKEADLLNAVTGDFPQTFITDGNKGSFEDQAQSFAKLLESQGTAVTTAFYPISEAELTHEYQFDMTLPQSQETFEALVAFLKELDS
ncbi:alpha/beta hydrolase [uncultured Vagococcus sp.]|uniref:alpha/beta hydrolase n=1 Tax=uncultured Vagococcus sp. TaxID=189676 RepID=UPI0028D64DE6|nr:alpha/beta hydrolase [uncultured Vagococcus sp.]